MSRISVMSIFLFRTLLLAGIPSVCLTGCVPAGEGQASRAEQDGKAAVQPASAGSIAPAGSAAVTAQAAAQSSTGDPAALVGIYAGEGADPYLRGVARRMFAWMGYMVTDIRPSDINNNDFKNIQLLYFPGGSTPPMRRDLSESGRDYLRAYIAGGCAYIGTCAGALMACTENIWEGRPDNYGLFGLLPLTGIGPIPELTAGAELPLGPGIAMARLELLPGHPSSAEHAGPAAVLSVNSPWFRLPAQSANPAAENSVAHGMQILARYQKSGEAAIVAGSYGRGRIVLTGPHPEIEEDESRDGNSYFDVFEDEGSDWPLMRSIAAWCLAADSGSGVAGAFDPPTVSLAGLLWMQQNYHPAMNPADDGSAGTPYGGSAAPDGLDSSYGWLYTWDEARRLCPPGWRLPARQDWQALFAAAGGEAEAGRVLKSAEGWQAATAEAGSSGTVDAAQVANPDGFRALPAGGASDRRQYDGFGWAAHFWSADQDGGRVAVPGFMFDTDAVHWLDLPPGMYASVRYVREGKP